MSAGMGAHVRIWHRHIRSANTPASVAVRSLALRFRPSSAFPTSPEPTSAVSKPALRPWALRTLRGQLEASRRSECPGRQGRHRHCGRAPSGGAQCGGRSGPEVRTPLACTRQLGTAEVHAAHLGSANRRAVWMLSHSGRFGRRSNVLQKVSFGSEPRMMVPKPSLLNR